MAPKHYLQITDEHFEQAVGGVRSIFVARARTEDPENDPLASWLDACPVDLTDEAKAGILATVRAAKQP